VLLVAAGLLAGVPPVHRASAQGPPWNVIVIMTDDLDTGTLQTAAHPPTCGIPCIYGFSFMPNYVTFFEQQGIVFTNSFVTYSLCCPSRATFFTGKYAHNHHVENNQGHGGGHNGGCLAFDDGETVGKWLKAALPAYHTGMIGKYLNGYGTNPGSSKCQDRYVPPNSWDDWEALAGNFSLQLDYKISVNGVCCYQGNGGWPDYQTKRLMERAVNFIHLADGVNQKFFLYLAPSAPHLESQTDPPRECASEPLPWGAVPTIRDQPAFEGWASGLTLPHPASYNEDLSDKPPWMPALVQQNVGDDCTQLLWRDRLEAMKSVDVMIGAVVNELQTKGLLNDTVLVFTSDNGFYNGEHKLHDKILGYEEGLRVPLAIHFPGSPVAGTSLPNFVLNTDLAPTILELAGLCAPYATCHNVDGRSLVPLLTNQSYTTRKRFLVEHWQPRFGVGETDDLIDGPADQYPDFIGIRTSPDDAPSRDDPANVVYMKYDTDLDGTYDQYEYYDNLDQYLLQNEYQTTNDCFPDGPVSCPRPASDPLYEFLTALSTCPGVYTCQALENSDHYPPP